jgi:hypothetical protein
VATDTLTGPGAVVPAGVPMPVTPTAGGPGVPTAPPARPVTPDLAFTGLDAGLWLAVIVALSLLGFALLWGGRRLDRAASPHPGSPTTPQLPEKVQGVAAQARPVAQKPGSTGLSADLGLIVVALSLVALIFGGRGSDRT